MIQAGPTSKNMDILGIEVYELSNQALRRLLDWELAKIWYTLHAILASSSVSITVSTWNELVNKSTQVVFVQQRQIMCCCWKVHQIQAWCMLVPNFDPFLTTSLVMKMKATIIVYSRSTNTALGKIFTTKKGLLKKAKHSHCGISGFYWSPQTSNHFIKRSVDDEGPKYLYLVTSQRNVCHRILGLHCIRHHRNLTSWTNQVLVELKMSTTVAVFSYPKWPSGSSGVDLRMKAA